MSKTSSEVEVFCDLDGVLVNFHKAASKIFGIPYPKQSVLCFDWVTNNTGISLDEFLRRISQCDHDFWRNLEPYPWTAEIIQFLDSTVPNWSLLSAAQHCPACWSGKAAWVYRYLQEPGMHKLILVTGNKYRVGGRGKILIDDSFDTCQRWRDAGGVAFHWKEYTEDHIALARAQVAELKTFILSHTQK